MTPQLDKACLLKHMPLLWTFFIEADKLIMQTLSQVTAMQSLLNMNYIPTEHILTCGATFLRSFIQMYATMKDKPKMLDKYSKCQEI